MTLVIEPAQSLADDGFVAGGQDSAKNYGASDELIVADKDQFRRALIRFDFGAIPPGSQINSAKLDLYLENFSGPNGVDADISVHAAQRTWVEGAGDGAPVSDGATWYRASAAQPWKYPGGDFDSIAASTVSVPEIKNVRYLWDVTSLVAQWVAGADSNYGFVLKIAQEANDASSVERSFSSNDANQASRRPRVTVDYTPASSQITVLQPASAAAGVDAFIRSGGDALRNYGRSPVLSVADQATLSRSLLRFDVSSIPAADRIDRATLDLHIQSTAGAETTSVSVHRVTRSWTEGTGLGTLTFNGASWTSTNGFLSWLSWGGDFAAAPAASEPVPGAAGTWQSWEVTDLVTAWRDSASTNYGAILKITSESAGAGNLREFQSSDASNPTLNPRLTLYITPNGNTTSAVDSARAEITPNAASAGSSTSYTYSILTFASTQSTGVDSVAIALPPGFALGSVSAVTVDLLPRAFTNTSDSTAVRIRFASPVTGSARIEVSFSATAPAAYDSPTSAVTSTVDDASTVSPAVACVEGSANLVTSDANSWDVVVNPPGLLSLRVTPDSAAVSADSTLDFAATVTDVIGGTSTVEPSWGVIGSIGTINSTGLFTPTTTGNGRVTATYLGLADSAGVRVSAGAPASVTISPASANISADSTRQFAAVVRDADGNVVATGVTWSVLGGIGSINAGGLFTATVAGSGSVRATAGAATGTAAVTVTPGAPASIVLSPDSVSVSADSTATFGATLRDADGNVTSGAINWSVAGGVGSIASGVFTPTTAGLGWVIASTLPAVTSIEQTPGASQAGAPTEPEPQPLAAIVSDSSRVAVTPGALGIVTITPASAALSADSTLLFSATGTDLDGNAIATFVPSWSVIGSIGTITPGGLFDARRTGSGRVVASNGGAVPADSADVTVVAGRLAGATLSPAAVTVSPGDTTLFTMRGRDADSNSVAIPQSAVAWSTNDPSGSITGSGVYTAGNNLSPPNYSVSASYGGFNAAASVTIISAGALARIEIADSSGAPIGDLALTADADGRRMQALGYGAANEPLGPVACVWSVLGASGVIAIDGGPAVEVFADFALAGAARVRIAGPFALADTTGVITVSAGALASIGVAPGPLSITTDTTLVFTAAPVDADGNSVAAGAIAWSVGGGIGTIGATTGLFDPETPGAGFARATAGSVSGDSPTITVAPGAAASLTVSPSSALVLLGATRQFTASVLDADGNTASGTPSWSATGSAGTVNATGLFTAASVGNASVIASLGSVADTAAVTVAEPGALRLLSVDSPRATVTEGQSGLALTLRFQNGSSSALTSFTPTIEPRDSLGAPIAGGVFVQSVSAPASVPAGADSALTVTVSLAPALTAGMRVVLDASLLATGGGGASQIDADADVTDEWLVEAPPKLVDVENTVWPRRLRRGASGVSLALRGWNDGGVSVDLDPAATRLIFSDGGASYTAPLAAPLSLPRDASAAEINFDTSPIPASMTAGIYPLTLIAIGIDSNGKAYAETLITEERNEVTVLPPYVTVTAAPVAGGAVRPGETNVPALAFDIENGYPDSRTLTTLSISNLTAGPGTVAQRDAEIARVGIVWDRDADGILSVTDSLLAERTFTNGKATVTGLSLAIGSEEAVRLIAAIDVAAGARDGDSLDLALAAAADIAFTPSATIDGVFPVNPSGRLAVDGSTAAQFGVTPIAPRSVTTGESLVTALDVTIPPNGYQPDTLTALAIALDGTAQAGSDVRSVTLVRRAADAGASAESAAGASDSTIGEMAWTGARWVRTGMSVPIPSEGLRLAALVTIADSATTGATIALEIPAGENAVTVRSGNDGPLDDAVEGGGPLTIALFDRIIALSLDLDTESLPQGGSDIGLAAFILANTYSTPRTVSSIRFVANTVLLDPARGDSLLDKVALCFDQNENGAIDAGEPPIATGALSGGEISFEDLAVVIAPGQSAYFVVVGNVSLRAHDGDSLSLAIPGPADLDFAQAVSIEGNFPLASTPLVPVAGMTAASITNHGAAPRSAPPGETDMLVLDVTVPANGYVADRLLGFRVENAGSASAPGDIAALNLYVDDGDGSFDTASDSLVDALSFVGSGWLIDALDIAVPLSGRRIFVAADVAAAPSDSATIILRVPRDGISVESTDDGPIDAPVENAFTQTLSTSPLLVSVAFENPSASVGQTLDLVATVRNAGNETIDAIVPTISAMAGTGASALVGGATPGSLSIPPSTTRTFTWRVRANAAGSATYTVVARGRGRTSEEDISSTPVAASPLSIVNPPVSVALFPTDLAPPTVSRGSVEVVPLSLTFAADGVTPYAPVEVRTLDLSFDDGAGRAVSIADLASRLSVREASTVFHTTSAVPAGSAVRLELDSPIVISPGDPVSVAIAIDVRADTRVAAFRLTVNAPLSTDVVDANSGVAVPLVLSSGAFPVRSSRTNVTARPTSVSMAIESIAPPAMNRGQEDVFVLGLRFASAGDTNVTADVRIHEVTLLVTDSLGEFIDSVFSDVTIEDGEIEYGDLSGFIPGGVIAAVSTPDGDARPILPLAKGIIRIPLTTPIVLPVNTNVPVQLRIDVLPGATAEYVRFELDGGDSTLLPQARDVATDTPIRVGLAAPFRGPAIRVATPASGLLATPIVLSDSAVYPGAAGVPLLSFSCRNPGDPSEADVALTAISLDVTDDFGAPQPTGRRLLSLSAFADGVPVGSVGVAESDASRARIPFTAPLLIAPGDSARIDVRTTIRGIAERGRLRASLGGDDLELRDANDLRLIVPVAGAAAFPFGSALITILAAPLDPIASFRDRAPVTAARGALAVPLGELVLVNPPAEGSGGVSLESIDFIISDSEGRTLDPASLFSATRVVDVRTTVSSHPADAMGSLIFPNSLVIAPGDSITLLFEGDLLGESAANAFRLTVADTGVTFASVIQGANPPRARAAAGHSFPFSTGLVGIASPRFAESLSNYPNPFAAGREETRFLFYMPEPGEIEIAIYTPLGEPVARIAPAGVTGAGMVPAIAWDGRNADGETVLSGVYLADVRVRFLSGRSESALRKVAVLR
ncbi:MAG: DNRLRE domain-containing protein [bacterium]